MHLENLKRVRDAIANVPDEAFDMANYATKSLHPCGTAACIAGHTLLQAGAIANIDDDDNLVNFTLDGKRIYPFEAAAEYLQLTYTEANYVFFGQFTETPMYDITREQALDYLDLVLKNGIIDQRID